MPMIQGMAYIFLLIRVNYKIFTNIQKFVSFDIIPQNAIICLGKRDFTRYNNMRKISRTILTFDYNFC